MIFTTGAFLRPIKVTQDGQELWMWTVVEFIDDSFSDGEVFNPPELSETEESLWVECDGEVQFK
jgi:hypothetical protein